MVYLAAIVPTPGTSIFEASDPAFESALEAYAEDGWRLPPPGDEVLDTYYGEHGLSAADKAWFAARAEPMSLACYRERVPDDLAAVEKLPRTYVTCAGDPGPAPDLPGWDRATIGTGHWPMITAPEELAELLVRL